MSGHSTLLWPLGLVFLAAPALALTIRGASVKIGGRRGDSFRFQGGFGGLSSDDTETVVVQLDRAELRVPRSEFKRRRKTLTYRGGRGAGQVSLLRLDLKKRRFVVTGSGWMLDRLSIPFRFAVGDEAATDCRLLRLKRRGKAAQAGPGRRPQRVGVITPGDEDIGCDRLGIPRTRPVAVVAGVTTDVEITVDVAAAGAVDTGSLRALRADGQPLCTLVPAAGSSPDRFACTATITEPAPTLLAFAVEGRSGEAPVLSPGSTLPVVGPATDEVVGTVADAHDRVLDVWADAKQRLGDSLAARMDAIRNLRAVDGILDAGLSPDGRDLTLRYTTGWLGLVILNRPPPEDDASPRATFLAREQPRRTLMPRGIFRSCDDGSGSGDRCCTPDDRTLLEGREVLIWNPGFFEPGSDDAPVVEAKLAERACLGFNVEKVSGAAADVASVHRFPAYSTLILSTHGGVDISGTVHVGTGEKVTLEGLRAHGVELSLGIVGTAQFEADGRAVVPIPKRGIFTVTEDYFPRRVQGRFPENAIVYASYCYSAAGKMPNVFVGAFGAAAYFGFDSNVSQSYTTTQVAPQLWDGLLKHLRTTKKAYDEVTPKVDPNRLIAFDPFTGKPFFTHYFARFVRVGRDGIAYVDAPKLIPENPKLKAGEQQTLTVEVAGKGSCDLTHHWHNEGMHGHLDGGDDIEGMSTDMTYEAQPSGEGGTDGIGAEVLPPDSDEPIGVACNDVTVLSQCGDGVRQEDEECDGGDDNACPGQCGPACNCTPGPSRVDVEIKGLAPGVGWQIVEADHDPPRIACPPSCSYVGGENGHGITRLRVFPEDDPRTQDPPYDVESFVGCAGTTGLPAVGPSCFLDSFPSAHVVVNLRYRPVIAVTMAGEARQAPFITGNPAPPHIGDASGFVCGGSLLRTQSCARHFSVGQGVLLATKSHEPGSAIGFELASWDGPCAGQGIGPGENRCHLVLGSTDVCITATFRPAGSAPAPQPYVGPGCPSGPAP